MTVATDRPVALFSTPLEVGLRTLILLNALAPAPADLQRLVVFDYLLVHSGDAGGPESMHPATPHRSGELLVKRDVLRRGLRLMLSRELVATTFASSGIEYRASPLTARFLSYLQRDYASALGERAKWVIETFGSMDDISLATFVGSHLERWGGEFFNEAAVRDVRA
jgi:hypothetical protein